MSDSPIAAVLRAVDALDIEACVSLLAPGCRLLATDGRVAEGVAQARALLGDFLGELNRTTHRVTAEWNPEPGVWIAELEATYELRDRGRHGPYPRVMVVRAGQDGITDLRFYGSHEPPLSDSERPYEEVRSGSGRWLPTL